MFNLKLTKLRILQERAKREQAAAEEVAYEKRVAFERVWIEYLNEAERNGLCRFCLKPRNEGSHEGNDHVAIGAVGTDEAMQWLNVELADNLAARHQHRAAKAS